MIVRRAGELICIAVGRVERGRGNMEATRQGKGLQQGGSLRAGGDTHLRPAARRYATISVWPKARAASNGVVPSSSALSLSAPCSTRYRTTIK